MKYDITAKELCAMTGISRGHLVHLMHHYDYRPDNEMILDESTDYIRRFDQGKGKLYFSRKAINKITRRTKGKT